MGKISAAGGPTIGGRPRTPDLDDVVTVGLLLRLFGQLGFSSNLAGTAGAAAPSVSLASTSTDLAGYYARKIAIDVRDYGAVGDGVTDDAPAIRAALAAAPGGSAVVLPALTFGVASPLVVPPNVTLRGTIGNRIVYSNGVQHGAVIKALASFSGTGVIRLQDKEEGGYSAESVGQRLENFTIEGSALVAASVRGVYATGNVREVIIHRVCVQNTTGTGFLGANYTRVADGLTYHPYSWYLFECMANNCGVNGFSFTTFTDSTIINCQALGCTQNGFSLAGANTELVACRAEWSLQHGFNITGALGTGTGSGGMVLTGCSTDRNNFDGINVNTTGNATVLIQGAMLRRDGRNSTAGGGGYAGLRLQSATNPVIVNGVSVYPGVDDDGAYTNSPENGVRASGSTFLQLDAASIHAATLAWKNDGDNTTVRLGPSARLATGSTSSITSYVGGDVTTFKTGDTGRSSTTSPTDDPHLTVSVHPSAKYLVEAFLVYDGDQAGDLQCGFTVPSGATFTWAEEGLLSTATGNSASVKLGAFSAASTDTVGAAGAGTKTLLRLSGVLTVAGTGGTFALKWSQGTSSITATTLYADSYLRVRMVS